MYAGNRSVRIQVRSTVVPLAVVAREMAFYVYNVSAVSRRRRVFRPLNDRMNLLLTGVRQTLQRQ